MTPNGPNNPAEPVEPAEAPTLPGTAPEPEPLVIRPPRRAVLWAAPALAAGLGLIVAGWYYDGFGEVTLALLGAGISVASVRFLLILLKGRTEAGPEGLVARKVRDTRRLERRRLERFEVVPTLFGRRVVVVLREPWQRYGLAAPRESLWARDPDFEKHVAALAATVPAGRGGDGLGLVRRSQALRLVHPLIALALAGWLLYQEKPWLEPWWPSNREVTALPDPCAVVDDATARRLVPGPTRAADPVRRSGAFLVARCTWNRPEWAGSLRVEYALASRVGNASGTASAARRVKLSVALGGEPFTGLGDEAYVRGDKPGGRDGDTAGGTAGGDGFATAELTARRANVVVKVEYAGELPAGAARSEAEAVTRRALGRVHAD
ncbi:hypothetical protein ACFY4C_29660 [Actinomadura viridis]|uniref:hypothetical protein n=1 Tax=Actinomadura viridis TaxID=58110 RepID=UPI0036C20CA5